MAKTIEFTAKNVKQFSSWLKKFASLEKSLLIEVDEKNKCFIAKSYNEVKSVVKYSKISFIDAGFILKKESKDPEFIKVGLYDISRLMKSLDHFSTGEFSFSVQYEEVIDGKEKDLAASALLIKGSQLKIKIDCSSLKVFKYLSDDIFLNRIAKTDVITNFDLSINTTNEINSLCDLDKEYDYLEFIVRDKKVFIKGKAFQLDVAPTTAEKALISIYKTQFNKIDLENYVIDFGEDKLVFRSKDSDTITVTSMVEKDQKYEEAATEF